MPFASVNGTELYYERHGEGRPVVFCHGEGLGLWLIHWIVISLDGELETTVMEGGTTVTIRLPKAP